MDDSQLHADQDNISEQLSIYKDDLAGDGYSVRQISVPGTQVPRNLPSDLTTQYASKDSIPSNVLNEAVSTFSAYRNAVTSLKQAIRVEVASAGGLAGVVLIGHVAVPYSGSTITGYDGHVNDHAGAWPADVYYASMGSETLWTDDKYVDNSRSRGAHPQNILHQSNLNYPGDGKFDQDRITAAMDVRFPVSRIDFADLPLFDIGGPGASYSETDLLNRYFERDHEYRTGQWTVQSQAFVDDGFRDQQSYGLNVAEFSSLVGNNNVKVASFASWHGWDPTFPNGTRVALPASADDVFDAKTESSLWGYIAGGGFPSDGDLVHGFDYIEDLPQSGTIGGFTYSDPVRGPQHSVFNVTFGSWVGDWDTTSSLERSVIADPDGYGLTNVWDGFSSWTLQGTGLGSPIGITMLDTARNRVSENQFHSPTLFPSNPSDNEPYGSIAESMQGDWTLRQDVLKPITALHLSTIQSGTAGDAPVTTTVYWTASTDAGVSGYDVYWSADRDGGTTGYTLLTAAAPVAGTSFVDPDSTAHRLGYYMVRARALTTTPSGSYWNLSTGIVAQTHLNTSTFYWGNVSQAFAIPLDNIDYSLPTSAVTLVATKWNATNTAYDPPVTLVAGGFRDPTAEYYIDHEHQIGSGLTSIFIGILTTSESGVAHVLPSGRYDLHVAYADGSSFDQRFVFVGGDTNNDGRVNFADLLVLAQNFNTTPEPGEDDYDFNSFGVGDFNGDGIVNFSDLLFLSQHFGLDLNY